jgi:hypothetical protein
MRRENLKKLYLFLLPFLLVIPYVWDGTNLFSVPMVFARTFHYNGFLFSLLQPLMSNPSASDLCWIAFFLLGAWIFFFVPHTLRAAYLLSGSLLLCTPVAHQWYFLLIVLFLPFYRSLPWWTLTLTICATFTTRIERIVTKEWVDYAVARWIEYLPLVVLGVWFFMRGKRIGPERFDPPEGVSIIIPTLNEASRIDACIESIQRQDYQKAEIIVVDGGSRDDTKARVRAHEGVRYYSAPAGRGGQIAKGIDAAMHDVILILHGDTLLREAALGRMMEALQAAPAAVGGAFGSAYPGGSGPYGFIAMLDNLRARFLGIAFGNQGQFFRKAGLKKGFPAFKLMEDVELSFRMKESGSILYLAHGVRNVPRRWKRIGYLRNMAMVIRLVALFVVKRRLGWIRDDCSDFYRTYYGEEK